MKIFSALLFTSLLIGFFSCNNEFHKTKTSTSGGYSYEFVSNDPTQTRIYTLDNGLKVYLSNFENAPRIHVFTAVKAGGKNDPENNTGLAHYLEHILFKGNKYFGTLDYEAEKPLLDSLENLFNDYASIENPRARAEHYKKIDAVSNEAAKFAIPNEYDKMISMIGGKGLNAYTTEDRTVYTVDIPANEMERFLTLEGFRFKQIVNRLFHTELEAVYEEKNRSLDSDFRKQYFALLQNLFPNHPYGTQSVIGTIDHLKNPSITEIKNYFNTYYRPNNVAICMSGELDFDKTIALIDKNFGEWEPNKKLPAFSYVIQPEITEPIEVDVLGPDRESLIMGFRFDGKASNDLMHVQLIDMILSNRTAGLIDLNLVQQQKVLSASATVRNMNDFAIHTFMGNPKEGQSLEDVKELLLGEIENIKKGNFDQWLLKAVINDLKKSVMEQGDSENANYYRANNMVMAFTREKNWKNEVTYFNRLSKITKEDLIAFAKQNYKDNYAVIYKRSGVDSNSQKVEKPKITKVPLNREQTSPLQDRLAGLKLDKLQPKFIDFKIDIDQYKIGMLEVIAKENTDNDLFSLTYLFDFGRNLDHILPLATEFMNYVGTDDMSPEEVKQEFYKLGANMKLSLSGDGTETFITLSGLSNAMKPAMQLFEKLLQEPIGSKDALDKLKKRILKDRKDIKKNKGVILQRQMYAYAKYGKDNPLKDIVTSEELKQIKHEELTQRIQNLSSFPHRILYYGNKSITELTDLVTSHHNVPQTFNEIDDIKKYNEKDYASNQVFWSHFDMVQTEIILLSKLDVLNNSKTAAIQMFNQYFGAGMNSIVFQEIREAQGLAYSVYSAYRQAAKKNESDYLFSYIGIQSDKQKEALSSMFNLINNLPKSPQAFNIGKQAILNKIESERITKKNMVNSYLAAEKKGLDIDAREQIYNEVKAMNYNDLLEFHKNYVKNKSHNILLIGDRNNIDFENLKQYGKVQELSLESLFGY